MTDHDNETDAERTARNGQLTRADLKGMTPHAIEKAREDGRLANLLGTPPEQTNLLDRATGPLSRQDIRDLAALGRHDLIEKARVEQRVDTTPTPKEKTA